MADVQTIFGNINSVIDQTSQAVVKVVSAVDQYRGTSPTMDVDAYSFGTPAIQRPLQATGLALLGLVLAAIVFLVIREARR